MYSEREINEFESFYKEHFDDIEGKFILNNWDHQPALVRNAGVFGIEKLFIQIPLNPSILENVSKHSIVKKASKKISLLELDNIDKKQLSLFRFKAYKSDETYGFNENKSYRYALNPYPLTYKYKPVKSLTELVNGTYHQTIYNVSDIKEYLYDFLSLSRYSYFLNYQSPRIELYKQDNLISVVILPKYPKDRDIPY